MGLRFSKMHGLGNDFMVIDGVTQTVRVTPEWVRRLADRRLGVGFDQLLLVEASQTREADFRYRIFNADGGEVEQCGNGARCFVRFVHENGLTDKTRIRVETLRGVIAPALEADGQVTVDMGAPRFAPNEIPLDVEREAQTYPIVLRDGTRLSASVLSMGNPHAVLRVDSVDSAPVAQWGGEIETHPLFPARINVGFMQIVDSGHIRLRVFERGTGETLACGTGACAAVVAGVRLGLLGGKVKVAAPGGALSIVWEGMGRPVWMTGPAVTVFRGELHS
ncbi:MAG: diaminopimelate epimerase [Zoogloeaceae bacterium]|jgi:diaminopimelate epimerase|nr:diaminopimelate epimerase [Zoogloeaceae bacterium]